MDESQRIPPAPRLRAALEELKARIRARYPTAEFEVWTGHEEPESIHLMATVDVDDLDAVSDLVLDRVLEMQAEEGLPIHVIPLDTPERTLAELARRDEEKRRAQSLARTARG